MVDLKKLVVGLKGRKATPKEISHLETLLAKHVQGLEHGYKYNTAEFFTDYADGHLLFMEFYQNIGNVAKAIQWGEEGWMLKCSAEIANQMLESTFAGIGAFLRYVADEAGIPAIPRLADRLVDFYGDDFYLAGSRHEADDWEHLDDEEAEGLLEILYFMDEFMALVDRSEDADEARTFYSAAEAAYAEYHAR
ncbi:MAG TPA: hypothetical protein VM327_05535 [Candidatus Thermoplasmatota archaeon]|nr:hypothetical protein [Candidatus Thermoplasmatota archaeon]